MSARTPTGARWSCTGCGFCCRFHTLGPVEPTVIADLQARGIEESWLPAAQRPWFVVRQTASGPQVELAKVDGACIFLQPDNRCAIHARFGAGAKPGFCREFPFKLVEDPLGTVVVARGSCEGVHSTSASGAPIEDQLEAILGLQRSYPVARFAPETVEVLPGVAVPLATWMAWEAQLLAALAARPLGPEAQLVVVRDWLVQATGTALSPAETSRYRLAARAVLLALAMTLDHVLATEQAPSPAEEVFTRQLRGWIELATAAIERPWPALGTEAAEHVDRLMRSSILGKDFQAQGGLPAGLGLWALNCLVARLVAPGVDGEPLDTAAFGEVYARWVRFTKNRSVDALLAKARPALVDLFLHATPDACPI